jgi:hypothetical protein
MRKLFNWLYFSNRPAHILCVGIMSLLLGWSAGVASIISLEYKDVQRGGWECWDWLDVVAGLIGCLIGGGVHFAIFKHW